MEKAIRTPRALVLGMPSAKFEVLKIYTKRDNNRYIACVEECIRVYTYRHVAQNYQSAEIIQPQTHGLWLPLVVCGCVSWH